MYCYTTIKLPFIPAFFGELVRFSTPPNPFPCPQCFLGSGSDVSCVRLAFFCALTFTGLITFVLEPIIVVEVEGVIDVHYTSLTSQFIR